MRILCLSDLHDQFELFAPDDLAPADVAVVAGDLTNHGMNRPQEVNRARTWLAAMCQRYPYVLWIGGNHDIGVSGRTFEDIGFREPKEAASNLIFLDGREVTIEGVAFGGINFSPCFADPELKTEWVNMTDDPEIDGYAFESIPHVDVLVSHCPPFECLDLMNRTLAHGGSPALKAWIEREKPSLVICGHIHEEAGLDNIGDTLVVNAARIAVLIDAVGREGKSWLLKDVDYRI